jgi:hypothetical protein
MPARKFSFDRITKYIFKNKISDQMAYSFTDPTTPGFSYLDCFQKDHWTGAAEILKESPRAYDVYSFAAQNHKRMNLLITKKIKPDFRDEAKLIYVEVGEIPDEPWGQEGDETVDEYNERRRLWEEEKSRWMTIGSFFYHIQKEKYLHDYKFV